MEIYYCFSKNAKVDSKKLLKIAFLKNGYVLSDYKIEIAKHGKPYIKNFPFEFNISHSQGLAVCVIGKNVGVDCEKIRVVKDSVIKKVCSFDEFITLEKSQNKTNDFISLWTFKEAFTKMIGSGFRYGFQNTTIYNAMYLHPNIKIYQKKIKDYFICAVERESNSVKIEEIKI